ncbi:MULTISPECIES: hypothetical protein [Symbiopectobacterium]|uniref:hypothetical protein n=1 Tax=Symbiopectobacterium TaxID=801 RepID=UPI001A2D5607|nr:MULTISPECIES: hypothetical protein [Symbiopectobacterium]MBG6249402.1 hypothetical protein [Candidatus Symbiopectobacterium sp. PLON1]MBT9428139.1 hypothetical protein [Candidatus Symbiopectobacterium endolongispinus]
MTTVNLKRLDNCVLNAQQISASDSEGNNNSTALAKKLHSIDNTPCVLQFGFKKGNIASTLNKQGTLFMGMPKMAMPMKPGYIRSLAHEKRGINNPIKYQGGPIYNPLNKHGNAFQGFSASMKREPETVRDVSKINSIDIGLDDHIFEKI